MIEKNVRSAKHGQTQSNISRDLPAQQTVKITNTKYFTNQETLGVFPNAPFPAWTVKSCDFLSTFQTEWEIEAVGQSQTDSEVDPQNGDVHRTLDP